MKPIRLILCIFCVVGFVPHQHAADPQPVRFLDIPSTNTVSGNDQLMVVTQPTSSPATRRITIATLLADHVNIRTYGAIPNDGFDDSAAIQAAFNAANGRAVFAPEGTWRIDTTVSNVTALTQTYAPGLKLVGEGSEKTIFDTRVASGPMLKIDTTAINNAYFQRDILLKGFRISGEYGSPASADGILLRHAYDARIEDVRIKSLSDVGVHIQATEGDTDGSNNIYIENSRIESCAGWGLFADCASGVNEISFLHLRGVSFLQCGTSSAATPPTSGAMKWKGQVVDIQSSAFAENANVGLFIYGAAGLANSARVSASTFENNTRRHVYIDGLDSGLFRANQLVNNNAFIATNGVYMDGATYSLRNVIWDNTFVRVGASNNSHVAFFVTGGNALYNRVSDTTWADYDYTGQTRFSASENDSIVHIVDNGVARARDVARTLRALANTQVAPPAGRGLEIFHGGTIGNIVSYNRTGGSYDALTVDGLTITLREQGTNRYQLTGGNNRFLSAIEYLSPSVQSISAGTAVAKTSSRQRVVGNGGAVTVTATPTVENGSGDGQILVVQGTDNTNTVTLQTESTLPNSNIVLTTATIALGQGDSVTLVYDATDLQWYEVARSLIP